MGTADRHMTVQTYHRYHRYHHAPLADQLTFLMRVHAAPNDCPLVSFAAGLKVTLSNTAGDVTMTAGAATATQSGVLAVGQLVYATLHNAAPGL